MSANEVMAMATVSNIVDDDVAITRVARAAEVDTKR